MTTDFTPMEKRTDVDLLENPSIYSLCEWLLRCERAQFSQAAEAIGWEDVRHYATRATTFAEWRRQVMNCMVMAGREGRV